MSNLPNIRRLIHAVLDGTASEADYRALEQAAADDPTVITQYVDAMNLHTALQWDARPQADAVPMVSRSQREVDDRLTQRFRSINRSLLLTAPLLVALAVAVVSVTYFVDDRISDIAQDNTPGQSTDLPPDSLPTILPKLTPPEIAVVANDTVAAEPSKDDEPIVRQPIAVPLTPSKSEPLPVAAFIDERLRHHWAENDVRPAERAAPLAWLRRASLDLKGRIPTRAEIADFVSSPIETRRDDFIAASVATDEFADHFANVWANLLIGRSPERAKYRGRLHDYLAESLAANRSWGEIAGELIAAEGDETNPPTNFLLAHLNNQAVPATAITSRVLLGRQVQCAQCHRHPFNDWKQDEFWQLNAFFQQCHIRTRRGPDGRPQRVLVDKPVGGPTFFENRRGVMQVAYPIYNGQRVDESPTVSRRQELASLLTTGESTELAAAMVNRVWAHFHGYGFTRDVDDLGPHAIVSHPQLLDRLTRAFVASGYDVGQLVTWVAGAASYQLASSHETVDGTNAIDRPDAGELPLFTRAYEKRLSPEQLYDSLVTAAVGPGGSVPGLVDRDTWVASFYSAQENDENSEMSTFDASPSVALEVMNGSLVTTLVDSPEASALVNVLALQTSDEKKLTALSLLVLGREPTPQETAALRKILRPTIKAYAKVMPGDQARDAGYRDLFWAYVNSSEFAVNR